MRQAGCSYATVTAWQKGSSGWKAQFSPGAGRVGSNCVVDGATRKQSTCTTPSGTYMIIEGFGAASSGTVMPYTKVDDRHWWVQDPESKFCNQMHTAQGADFPLAEVPPPDRWEIRVASRSVGQQGLPVVSA